MASLLASAVVFAVFKVAYGGLRWLRVLEASRNRLVELNPGSRGERGLRATSSRGPRALAAWLGWSVEQVMDATETAVEASE